MNEAEEFDAEAGLEQLVKIGEDLERDKRRYDALLRKGTLNTPSALASEVVQTLVPTMHDGFELTGQLLDAYQEGLFSLEDAVYQQNPRAMQALVELLCQKSIIDKADGDRVISLLTTQEVESVLSASDSAMIIEQLEHYRNIHPTSMPESLAALDATIARVKEISAVGGQEDEDEANEEGAGTIEATAEAV